MTDLPAAISFLKLRGLYAATGNDANPYLLTQTYSFLAGGPNGCISRDNLKPFPGLKPGLTKALEFGIEMKLLKNRLGIDLGWYNSNSVNQLFRVAIPPASGWSEKFINAGSVDNSGIELTLTANPFKTTDFSWDIDLNFAKECELNNLLIYKSIFWTISSFKKTNVSLLCVVFLPRTNPKYQYLNSIPYLIPIPKNTNKLVELTPDLKILNLAGDFMNNIRAVEGKPLGEIYSRGYARNAKNKILVGTDGLPQITPETTVYLGNSRPDWTGGITNRS